MTKNKKKIIGVIGLLLIIFIISLLLIFKINNFNFKSFRFENNKKITTSDKTKESDEKSNEDYLPSEEELVSGTLEGETSTSIASGEETTKNKTSDKKKTTNKVASSDMPKVSTAKFNSDINSVKLNPIKTRNSDLDSRVEKIINSVTNNSMTNNQKLYAVFRYIIDYADYGTPIIYLDEQNALINKYHYSYQDGIIVNNALTILKNKYGVCDNYASLLTVIARRIGFDAYFVGGSVKKSGGGTTPHAWVNIKANGNWYNLDAQIADRRPSQESFYYGKTDKEVNLYTYNRTSYVEDFNKFKTSSPLKLQVSLSGAVSDIKTVESYSSNIIKNVNYSAYKGSTLNINIKTSGASTYKYQVKVRSENSYNYEVLYAKDKDKTNNINLSKTFNESKEGYYFYVTVWNTENGNIAEFYFYVSLKEDNRMKDLKVSISKAPNNLNRPQNYTATFSATVSKVNSSSTCKPTFEYVFISSNDTSNPNGYYGIYGKDGGPAINMDYIPGKTYNLKVIARCGNDTLEKTFIVS